MRILVFIVAAFTAWPALAENALTTALRAAVAADDPSRAQTLIADAHTASLASHDTTAIYSAYRRIFGSTDPARADFINYWIEAYPKSAFAQTALAEQMYMTAFAYRQPRLEYPADSPAIQKLQQLFTLARNAAQRAIVLDRSFSRATDLWLFMVPYGADPEAVVDFSRKTMLAAPNRRTAIFTANALADDAPGDSFWVFDVCAEFAPLVPNFDPDTCAIASIFTNLEFTPIEEMAVNALDANDDPDLASARVASIVYYDRATRYTVENAIAMQMSLLETTPKLDEWMRFGQALGAAYPDSFFAAEAVDLASVELAARLADDPYNPNLIQMRLNFQDYLDTGTANLPDLGPGGEMKLWEGGLRYGYLTQGYWLMGSALLVRSGQGPAARLPYLENAVVSAGNASFPLGMFVVALGDVRGISGMEFNRPEYPAPAADMVNFAAAECPMLRASRLLLATCMMDRNINATECSDTNKAIMQAQVAVQQAKAGDLCPALATTPLSELVYKDMVAVPGFTPPATSQ